MSGSILKCRFLVMNNVPISWCESHHDCTWLTLVWLQSAFEISGHPVIQDYHNSCLVRRMTKIISNDYRQNVRMTLKMHTDEWNLKVSHPADDQNFPLISHAGYSGQLLGWDQGGTKCKMDTKLQITAIKFASGFVHTFLYCIIEIMVQLLTQRPNQL